MNINGESLNFRRVTKNRAKRIEVLLSHRLSRIETLLSGDTSKEATWNDIHHEIMRITQFSRFFDRQDQSNLALEVHSLVHTLANMGIGPLLHLGRIDKARSLFEGKLRAIVQTLGETNDTLHSFPEMFEILGEAGVRIDESCSFFKHKHIKAYASKPLFHIFTELCQNYIKYGSNGSLEIIQNEVGVKFILTNSIKPENTGTYSSGRGISLIKGFAKLLSGEFDTKKEGEKYTSTLYLPPNRIFEDTTSLADGAPSVP